MGTNLRQKQTAALNRMLNFNVPLADSENGVVNPSEWSDHVCCTCLPQHLLKPPHPPTKKTRRLKLSTEIDPPQHTHTNSGNY